MGRKKVNSEELSSLLDRAKSNTLTPEDCDLISDMAKVIEYVSGSSKELFGERLFVNDKIGRNEQCYCGSGKKYKRCCGRN